jgi:hypothetical protein
MADLPEASVQIDDEAGALAGGTDLLAVFACVEQNADLTPRQFSSLKSLLTKHGYSAGVDYCGTHFEETKKPVIFVGLPTVVAGAIGRIDTSGNTGSSVISVAAGVRGVLEEANLIIKIVSGGIVGTDQIVLDLSADGGITFKRVRLGTANSYTLPYYGLVVSFGAGTLVTDDVAFKCSSTGPRWDAAGLTAARLALAAQKAQVRSWLIVGDLTGSADANNVLTEVNGYETGNERFVFTRVQARDRKKSSTMSRVKKVMSGAPTLTFAEVGGTGDTITRSTGSWIADGFAVGDVVTVAGSASTNNVTGPIAALTALVLTFGTTDLAAEGPLANCTVVGSSALTFAEVGATGDTITRASGSWFDDGFAVGDVVTIAGTALNNVTGPIAALTSTLLTFGTTDLAAEVIGSHIVTIIAGEDDPTWVSALSTDYGSIDAQRRIDIGAGRGFKKSELTGWTLRRPVQWATSLREFKNDVQIPTYRKSDGPLSGWSLEDGEGNVVEHDERTDGGLLGARFTCFRTYANGPAGAFIALSLTRAIESSVLSRTHNMAVADVACSVSQAETENAIGQVLELNADGTGSEASLVVLEERVNSALAIALLQSRPDGKRASEAKWSASRSDVLNVPEAELTGTLDLRLNGTLEKISTRVRVQTAG